MPIEDSTNATDSILNENLLIPSVVVFILCGLLFVGSVALVDTGNIVNEEVVLTGSTTELSEESSVLPYEDLPETEQSKFRESQPQVYNYSSNRQVTLSSNTDPYVDYTHILLDGTYYEIEQATQPTTAGVGIIVTATTANLGLFVSGLGIILGSLLEIGKYSLDRLSLTTMKNVAIIFVIMCTLIGAVTPVIGFLYADPVTAVETTDQQPTVDFADLSSDEKTDFVTLASGQTVPADDTTLERGITIKSDGELYTVTDAGITTRNIIISLISGSILLFTGSFLAYLTYQTKYEIVFGERDYTYSFW